MYRITGFLLFILCFISFVHGQLPELMLQDGHKKPIIDSRISPDNKYIVSGGYDNTVKMWEKSSGRLINEYNQPAHFVSSLDFSPGGEFFAAGSYDANVYYFSVSSEKTIHRLEGHGKAIESVDFHPNGNILASAGRDSTIRLWNPKNGELLKIFNRKDIVYDIDFSPSGKYLSAAIANGNVIVWNIAEDKQIHQYQEHRGLVRKVAFSPNGDYLASLGYDKRIKLWSLNNEHSISTLKHLRDMQNNYSFFTDFSFGNTENKLFATTKNNRIVVWDTPEGSINRTVNTRQHEVNAFDIAPNGKFCITADKRSLDVRSLDKLTIDKIIKGNSLVIQSLNIDSNNQYFVLGTNSGIVTIASLGTGKIKKSRKIADAPIEAAEFFPDSHKLLVCQRNGKILVWNWKSDEITNKYTDLGFINTAEFRIDGKYFVTSGKNNSVKFFETSTGKLMRTFTGHQDKVMDLALSSRGKTIASAGWDGKVKLWDVYNDELIRTLEGHNGEVWSVIFSKNNEKVISAGRDKTIRIWDVSSGKLLNTLRGHEDYIESLALSPDGKHIISGSWDQTIKVWELKTGKLEKTLNGHDNYVKTLNYSPNGEIFISGGTDGRVKFWNTSSYSQMLSYVLSPDGSNYVITQSDGYFDGTHAAIDQSLHYVKNNQPISLSSLQEKYHIPNLWPLVMKGRFSPSQSLDTNITPPPEVHISVSDNNLQRRGKMRYESSRKRLKLTVNVKKRGRPLKDIRLYHNGKLVADTNRGFKRAEDTQNSLVNRFEISLLKGENKIFAVVRDVAGTQSHSDTLYVDLKGIKPDSDLYVFAVGINKYKNASMNLNYAKKDATAFIEALNTGGRKIFKDIHTTYLKDREFSKENFINTIKNISSQSDKNDVFVFFYAGHGVTTASDPQNTNFYIIPYGITQIYGNEEQLKQDAISARLLRKYTREIPARKQLLLFDACHSGKAVDKFTMRGAVEQKALIQLARSSGIALFASSGTEQVASEINEIGHGVFTYALLQALSGEADGGLEDDKITVSEIKAFLDDRIPQLTQKYRGQTQYPVGFVRGNDFPVVIAP